MLLYQLIFFLALRSTVNTDILLTECYFHITWIGFKALCMNGVALQLLSDLDHALKSVRFLLFSIQRGLVYIPMLC